MRLIHLISSVSMGAPERYALDICSHFASEGHEVVAMTRDAKAVDTPLHHAGIHVCHAPLRDYPDFFSSMILRKLLISSPLGETVVHVHRYRDALTAIAARKLAKRPDVRIIATRHKSAPGKNNPLRRFIYRNIDAHVFVSERSRREFLEAWPGGRYPFDSRRTHVALNSRRNIPACTPEPERGAITAMWHGRIRPGKGLETLIEAFGLLKSEGSSKIRLKIVGTGNPDYVDSLRTLAMRHDVLDRIDWIRNCPDPLELISGCHFGVLPTVSDEPFGLSNIEYMMAGRPQISSFNGAQSEYMTPGTEALEVAPGDVSALAEAIGRLAADAELRRRMGEAARRRYDRDLAWPIFIARITRIYQK